MFLNVCFSNQSEMAELRKFLKVLVAVDGSEYSMKAAEHAISIAKQFGSEVIALHVITSDMSTSLSASFSPEMEKIKKKLECSITWNALHHSFAGSRR